MEDVSKWTQKQWNAAKAKWSEEKTKWNDCQTQAKAKNLSGRKSWQFLYDCITKYGSENSDSITPDFHLVIANRLWFPHRHPRS
jgi:hypothetical protein